MNKINLHMTVTTSPDFSGGLWFIEAGTSFDAGAFAEHSGVNFHDLDAADVHAVQDRAAQLAAGEWLRVEITSN